MSLLNKVANREVFDFLRTLTIKSNYFAEKSRESQIVREFEDRTPETAVPYIIHLAGEYIFNNEDYELFPQQMMVEGEPWFKGYRKTKDDHVVPFKNYWRNFGDALSRVSAQDLEYLIDPSAEGLYEIQPYTVKGVTNPITVKRKHMKFVAPNLFTGLETSSILEALTVFLDTSITRLRTATFSLIALMNQCSSIRWILEKKFLSVSKHSTQMRQSQLD